MTDSVIEITCLRSDFSVVGLREYLLDAARWSQSVPPAPPIKKRARAAAPKTLPGSRLTAGGAAGVVIGVLAALALLGALVWFVARPRWQERRAQSFRKAHELDGGTGGGAAAHHIGAYAAGSSAFDASSLAPGVPPPTAVPQPPRPASAGGGALGGLAGLGAGLFGGSSGGAAAGGGAGGGGAGGQPQSPMASVGDATLAAFQAGWGRYAAGTGAASGGRSGGGRGGGSVV